MNKTKLSDDFTEIIGALIYSIQEETKGKYPGDYDISDWREIYSPPPVVPPYIRLNVFKNKVDSIVSTLLIIIDKYSTNQEEKE